MKYRVEERQIYPSAFLKGKVQQESVLKRLGDVFLFVCHKSSQQRTASPSDYEILETETMSL